jgi:hypothetical protein
VIIDKIIERVKYANVVGAIAGMVLAGYLYKVFYDRGAIAHHEGRVAVTVLPDGSKVLTTVKENSK